MPENSHEFCMFHSHQSNRVNLKSLQYFSIRLEFKMFAFKTYFIWTCMLPSNAISWTESVEGVSMFISSDSHVNNNIIDISIKYRHQLTKSYKPLTNGNHGQSFKQTINYFGCNKNGVTSPMWPKFIKSNQSVSIKNVYHIKLINLIIASKFFAPVRRSFVEHKI